MNRNAPSVVRTILAALALVTLSGCASTGVNAIFGANVIKAARK